MSLGFMVAKVYTHKTRTAHFLVLQSNWVRVRKELKTYDYEKFSKKIC